MLLDFTKEQFSGLAGDYTSSKGKRDILREAVLVGGSCLLRPCNLHAGGRVAVAVGLARQLGFRDPEWLGSSHANFEAYMFLHLQAIYANPQKLCDQSGVVGQGGEAEGVLSSDLLLMGIMASDVRLALRGFRDWCEALGLEYVIPENRVRGEG